MISHINDLLLPSFFTARQNKSKPVLINAVYKCKPVNCRFTCFEHKNVEYGLVSLNFLYSQHPNTKSFGRSKMFAIYSHRLNIVFIEFLALRERAFLTRYAQRKRLCHTVGTTYEGLIHIHYNTVLPVNVRPILLHFVWTILRKHLRIRIRNINEQLCELI